MADLIILRLPYQQKYDSLLRNQGYLDYVQFLKEQNIDVEELKISSLDKNEIIKILSQKINSKTNIIISIIRTSQITIAITLAKYLKKKFTCTIIFGKLINYGAFSTPYYYNYKKSEYLDYLIPRENGEIAVLNYLKGDSSYLINCRKDNDTQVKISKMDINELKTSPIPSKDIVLTYELSRGCPNKCFYCSNSLGEFSFNNVKKAVKEIKKLKKLNKNNKFVFVGSQINFDNNYLEIFLEDLINSQLNIEWTSYAVLKNLNRNKLLKMKKAGCKLLSMGLESANPKTLKSINKNIDLEEAEQILKDCYEIGINVQLHVMVGFPYEKEEDIFSIKSFLLKNKKYITNVNISDLVIPKDSIIGKNPKQWNIIVNKNGGDLDEEFLDFYEEGSTLQDKSNEINNRINNLNKFLEDHKINKFNISTPFDESFENIYLSSLGIDKKFISKKNLLYYLTYQFIPKSFFPNNKYVNSSSDYDYNMFEIESFFDLDEQHIKVKLYENLKVIIEKQISKVNGPIGLLLSGGVDSTIILHLLRELTDRKIYTITGAYNEESSNLKIARNLSKKYNTSHTELIITSKDLLKLKEVYSKNINQTIGDNGLLSTYLMLKELSKKTLNVFSGDGADCLFSGLSSHYNNYIYETYLKKVNFSSAKNEPYSKLNNLLKAKSKYPNFEHYSFGEIFLTQKEAEHIEKGVELSKPFKDVADKILEKNVIKRQILLDLNFFVKNRVDYIISSAESNNINILLPFLDKDFVDFSLKIPSELLIKNLNQKYILKKAFQNRIPDEILNRAKEGFTPPFKEWFSSNKEFVIKNLLKSCKLGLPKNYIDYLIKKLEFSEDYEIGMKIWLILNLVIWHENYLL